MVTKIICVFKEEFAPLFMVGALIVTVLQVTGLLEVIQEMVAPVTGVLKLPREANIFIMGMIRRDFGAAGLTDLAVTPEQYTGSINHHHFIYPLYRVGYRYV